MPREAVRSCEKAPQRGDKMRRVRPDGAAPELPEIAAASIVSPRREGE